MDAYHAASLAASINCIIGALITGTIFVIEFFGILEQRKSVSLRTSKKRWRLPLAGCSLFAFCVFILDGVLVWENWIGRDQECQSVIYPHVFFYMVEKQCIYTFLYDRAKIVHESLAVGPKKAKYMSLFRWLLWLIIWAGIPLFFYWVGF
jgi:hypothetical protein